MIRNVPKNLLYTIFLFFLFGICTDLQFLVISTLTESLKFMENCTLQRYGIPPNESNLSLIQSIISSSASIGVFPSLYFIIPLMETKGRTFLCVYLRFYICIIVSILQIIAALFQSAEVFLISQISLGIMFPIRTFLVLVYIGECAPDKHRGFATTSIIFCNFFGDILMYVLSSPSVFGTPDRWYWIPIITGVLSLLTFIGARKLPDSPKWLFLQNRCEEAKQSIKFFHGSDCDDAEILLNLKKEANLTTSEKLSITEIWRDDTLRQAFKIIVAVSLCLSFNTTIVESLYTIDLHEAVGFNLQESLTISIFTTIIFIPTRFIGPLLIDVVGRRVIFSVGVLIMYVKLWIMAASMWFSFYFGPTILTKTLLIFGDLLSELYSGLGTHSLIPLLINELLPLSAKTSVSQIIMLFELILNVPGMLMFPMVILTFPAAFYFPFILFQPIVFFYIFKRLPETKLRAVCDIIDSFDNEVASRTATINFEKLPLLRNRACTTFIKRESILNTRTRAYTFDHNRLV